MGLLFYSDECVHRMISYTSDYMIKSLVEMTKSDWSYFIVSFYIDAKQSLHICSICIGIFHNLQLQELKKISPEFKVSS